MMKRETTACIFVQAIRRPCYTIVSMQTLIVVRNFESSLLTFAQ